MTRRPHLLALRLIHLALPVAASVGLVAGIALGISASPAHAAALRAMVPASCSSAVVSPGPLTISGWIGGNMNVTLTGCGQTINGNVTAGSAGAATLSFTPGTTMYPGIAYAVSGSATVSGQQNYGGICVVWSLTCTIAPGTTLTINPSTGAETVNGAIYCQGTVTFTGQGITLTGTTPTVTSGISGNGQDPPPTATPELSSGALVVTGIVPTVWLIYRRRRNKKR